MKKWIYSALAYLVIVIVGYSLYTNFVATDEEKLPKSEHVDDHAPTENGVTADLKYNIFMCTQSAMKILSLKHNLKSLVCIRYGLSSSKEAKWELFLL